VKFGHFFRRKRSIVGQGGGILRPVRELRIQNPASSSKAIRGDEALSRTNNRRRRDREGR
jgi:hypothetical protein